jgi:hypothetical protein
MDAHISRAACPLRRRLRFCLRLSGQSVTPARSDGPSWLAATYGRAESAAVALKQEPPEPRAPRRVFRCGRRLAAAVPAAVVPGHSGPPQRLHRPPPSAGPRTTADPRAVGSPGGEPTLEPHCGRGPPATAAGRAPPAAALPPTCHQHDGHLFSLALLPEHNMEDEGKRNMCPAHFFRRVFQDTSPRHVDSSLPPTPARVSCTVADEQHARTWRHIGSGAPPQNDPTKGRAACGGRRE